MPKAEAKRKATRTRPLAVIDIGSTAIRMAIAQVDDNNDLHILDSLKQNVAIGNDTFTCGSISDTTMEECVAVLKTFQQVLYEYGVPEHPDQLRVVATSAVREANNRDAFLDRIAVATDLAVEVVHAEEAGRFMYLSILPYVGKKPLTKSNSVLCVDLGGGSTDVLYIEKGQVNFFHNHNFGAMRLVQEDDELDWQTQRFRDVLEEQVQRLVQQITGPLNGKGRRDILLGGGMISASVRALGLSWPASGLLTIPIADIRAVIPAVLQSSSDQLVQIYQLSYPEAETLAPALLSYLRLAETLKRNELYATNQGMRDGVLADLIGRCTRNRGFRQQIINSACAIGEHFLFDRPHAEHVMDVAIKIFKVIASEHSLTQRHQLILQVAALLHEIGLFVSNHNHHLHSQYLIINSDLFGLGGDDKKLAACVARYHRKNPPQPDDEIFCELSRDQRIDVAKLAAILRVADCFDRTHSQLLREISVQRDDRQLVIAVAKARELSLERLAIQRKGAFFQALYGISIDLKAVKE